MSYLSDVEQAVEAAVLKWQQAINLVLPENQQIESLLLSSFEGLPPEEQARVIEQLGPEWYVKLATKIARQHRQIDNELR